MTEEQKKYYIEQLNKYKEIIPADKYNHAGIYCIKVKDQIVYIGRSKDMQNRIANHMFWLIHSPLGEGNEKKYIELHEAYIKGINISFDVLTFVEKDDIIELKYQEAKYIRKYLPVLNSDIPRFENKAGFKKQCGRLNL